MDVCFRYATPPGDREMRAIECLWEVYGIGRTRINEQNKTIRVEYDATRLNVDVVAASIAPVSGIDAERKKLVLA